MENEKHYSFLFGLMLILLVLYAFIPSVEAYNLSLTPVMNVSGSPVYLQIQNLSQFQAACTNAGYCDHDQFNNHFSHQYFGQYNDADSLFTWGDNDNWYGSVAWDSAARYGYQYVRCWLTCGSGTYKNIQTGWVYRTNYSYPPFTASFSAIPQSGNQTLAVNFTPNVMAGAGFNLDRVVWDYDGGLGTETKTTQMNTSFIKNYTSAGHFTARLTAYDNVGKSLSSSQSIDVYNYTMGITPTPTLTPTPTTTPLSQINQRTMTGKDVTNSTPISGLTISMIDTNDVGAGWCNVTANNGSYTFSYYGSSCNIPAQSSHIYEWIFSKTGYKSEIDVESFGYDGSTTVYLSPTAYTPASSNFVLQTQITGQNNLPIQNPSGSVKISNLSSTWSNTVSYSGSSFALFSGLKPGDSYKLDFNVIGYQTYSDTFSSSSSMGGTTQYYQALLQSSTILPSSYTLNVNPTQGGSNDTYTLTLTGDFTNVQQIDYLYSASDLGDIPFTEGSYKSQYKLISAAWKQWDGSAWQASSMKTIVNVKFNTLSSLQTSYTPRAIITTTSGSMYYAYGSTISLISSGGIKTRIRVYAGNSAGIVGTTLYPYQIYIYNTDLAAWTNKTITMDDMMYSTDYTNIMAGAHIQYSASASGYSPSALTSVTLPIINNPLTGYVDYAVVLYPITSLPAGNVSLYTNVDLVTSEAGLKYYPIQNAKVTLSDSQSCLTNSVGACSFTVLGNTTYTVTASYTGYSTIRQNIYSTMYNNTVSFHLIKIPVTTSIIGQRTPIGFITTIPIPSTYAINQTAGASCSIASSNATVKEQIMNYIACNGVTSKDGQNAMLALVIMIFSGSILARYAKGIGAIAGVIAGAGVSFYMGLLPFWILIFVLICAGVVFASKIYGGGK